jgi:NifB/MoaA-like Fe-S oxidoreductase
VLQSVSIVPVGLTKYREGLYPLELFNREDAREVLEVIHRWQNIMMEKHGIHFVHASDEWYILAEMELPEEERYDGYLQLENGVGMLRLLQNEVAEALAEREGDDRRLSLSTATGRLAAPYVEKCLAQIREKFPGVQAQVYTINNEFFGEQITVSGLLTGQDLEKQLAGKNLGDRLLIPCNMLRSGESVFLDDITAEELAASLRTEIVVVGESGEEFTEAVLEPENHREMKRRQMYEQTSSSYSGKA